MTEAFNEGGTGEQGYKISNQLEVIMHPSEENVKPFQHYKDQMEMVLCAIIARVFYADKEAPPKDNVVRMMDALMNESTNSIKGLFKTARDAVEQGKNIIELCPVDKAIMLADLADKYYIPGWTWQKLISEARTAYTELQQARERSDGNESNESHTSNESHAPSHESQGSHTKVTPESHPSHTQSRFEGNLSAELKKYIEASEGVITSAQIDREFGIISAKDKNIRRKILSSLRKEGRIRKDKNIVGKYYIPKREIEFIDLENAEIDTFDLKLPLKLDEKLIIPKKSIFVIAGVSNAGKTVLALNIIKDNLEKDYPVFYCMSEMGPGEYKRRIIKIMDGDVKKWADNVKSIEAVTGFSDIISEYNPNGLTVIDYLEEQDGEAYKIAAYIREIYEALNDGVAVICLQKHSKAEVGRGGEGTVHKARVYLTMDPMTYRQNCFISAVKVFKAKEFKGEINPNKQEVHFEIRGGSELRTVSDWMYCNTAQRLAYIKRYEHMLDKGWEAPAVEEKECCYRVTLEDGTMGNILKKDIETWQKNLPDIDVENLLSWLEGKTKDGEMKLTKKSWFVTIGNILAKKQEQSGVKEDSEAPF